MSNGGLGIQFTVSALDRFSSTFRDLERQTRGISSAAGKVGVAVGAMAAAAGAAVAGVGAAIGKVGVEYNAMMEQSAIAWETILGDANKAKKTMKELETMGKETPFEFEGLDKAAKLLNMAGFEGDKLFESLTNVGDAVSAVGGGQDELEGVSMAIFQMASKGKISAEEMNQLAERGIPAWQMMADSMGKTVPELMEMSQQGKLFAKDVLPELIDGMGNKFGGAMQKQSTTFNGLMSTMKDNLKILSGELAKPLFDSMKNGLQNLMPLLDGLTAWAKGDFKGFSEIMKQSFGAETGGKIVAFAQSVSSGMSTAIGWLNKGKLAMQALFEYFQGDNISAIELLTKMGLSTETIVMINDTVSRIKESISGFIDGYKTAVSNLFSGDGNIGQSFVRIFNVIKGVALPILQDAVSFIKGKLDTLKQFWAENGTQITQAVKNMWNVIAGIFEFIAPVLIFIVKSLWSSVMGVIDGAIKIILGIIKVFTGIFTLDFSMMWEGVKSLFVGALQFIWNLINLMLVGKALSGIKAFISNGISSFKGFATSSKDLMLKIVDDIAGFFKGLGDDMIGFGKNIVEGLINGIKSKISGLINTAKSIADTVTSTIRGALDIHSPSRIMMEVGAFAGAGFSLGLGDQLNEIKSVSRDMASAAIPSAPYQSRAASPAASQQQAAQRITVEVPLYLDSKEIARSTVDDISKILYSKARLTARVNGFNY